MLETSSSKKIRTDRAPVQKDDLKMFLQISQENVCIGVSF